MSDVETDFWNRDGIAAGGGAQVGQATQAMGIGSDAEPHGNLLGAIVSVPAVAIVIVGISLAVGSPEFSRVFGFVAAAIVGMVVFADAKTLKQSGAWGVGTFLFMLPVLPMYVYQRPKYVWRLACHTEELAVSGTPVWTQEEDLHDQIARLKQSLAGMQTPYPPMDLYNLGRLYALLFDVSTRQSDRDSALKYMKAAAEADPDMFTGSDPFGDYDLMPFGSLEKDPDFKEFAT